MMNIIKKIKIKVCFFILAALFLGQTSAAMSPNEAFKVERASAKWNKDKIVRILAIGNSFSQDAIEHYLYDLAKAGGHKVIIGNLYIGGASLDLHWKNASGDSSVYSFRKTGLDGKKNTTVKTSIAKALADEKWDYISFQQSSPNSGLFETYVKPLPLLFAYVKERATNPKVKYVFHQTWAYAQSSPQGAFATYGKDQMKMYQAIMDASKKAKELAPFNVLVPSGTAIQNARTSFMGDNMCRDGFHLDLNRGRYTASCVWYEAIFKESVIGNTYRPEKVTEREAAAAQAAAHYAIKNPFNVTPLKAFQD